MTCGGIEAICAFVGYRIVVFGISKAIPMFGFSGCIARFFLDAHHVITRHNARMALHGHQIISHTRYAIDG